MRAGILAVGIIILAIGFIGLVISNVYHETAEDNIRYYESFEGELVRLGNESAQEHYESSLSNDRMFGDICFPITLLLCIIGAILLVTGLAAADPEKNKPKKKEKKQPQQQPVVIYQPIIQSPQQPQQMPQQQVQRQFPTQQPMQRQPPLTRSMDLKCMVCNSKLFETKNPTEWFCPQCKETFEIKLKEIK